LVCAMDGPVRQLGARLLIALFIRSWKTVQSSKTHSRGLLKGETLSPSQRSKHDKSKFRAVRAFYLLAHRVGSPLLLLGSYRLRNPVYGGFAVSSFARVEHPDDRHPDEDTDPVSVGRMGLSVIFRCLRLFGRVVPNPKFVA
jgi:hypothetical protein